MRENPPENWKLTFQFRAHITYTQLLKNALKGLNSDLLYKILHIEFILLTLFLKRLLFDFLCVLK
jgi:hypothetical protein